MPKCTNTQIVLISEIWRVLLMSAFPLLSCSLEVYAKSHKYQGKIFGGFEAPESFMRFRINILHEVYESSQLGINYVFQNRFDPLEFW